MNEILLISSVFVYFGSVLVFFFLAKKAGLYAWTCLCAIAANIEVLILIKAFGMEQTLGNVLFASTFLVTDILSEVYGKKAANRAVFLGILVTIMFIVISLSWRLFVPSINDSARDNILKVFNNTPRVMLAGFIAYAISQVFDVWAYHTIWHISYSKFKDKSRFLWLRNNGSTLVSQAINTAIFTLGAFLGIYSKDVLISILLSTYVIYIFTSILDTPFLYIARMIARNRHKSFLNFELI